MDYVIYYSFNRIFIIYDIFLGIIVLNNYSSSVVLFSIIIKVIINIIYRSIFLLNFGL